MLAQPPSWVGMAEHSSPSFGHHEMCRTSTAGCAARKALDACRTHVASRQAKEYFPESRYRKASPRIASREAPKPHGGGHYHIGKPYKVGGVWYHPELDPDYSRVGRASWYGAAFDGRLTANGEVYDMHGLTAASPTLPLPSYARVTNLRNGSSIVVRVNDRGPFAKGRIIDLSACAAKLLAYAHSGAAKVKVDYVGPAPLHGNDQPFLMASYKPPDGAGRPANGAMIAFNGSTPGENGHEPASSSHQPAIPTPTPRPATTFRAKAAASFEPAAERSVDMIAPGDPTPPATVPLAPQRSEDLALAADSAGIDFASVGSIPHR